MTVKPVGTTDPGPRPGPPGPPHNEPLSPPPREPFPDGGTDFPYTLEAVGQARRSLGGDLRRLAVAPTAADDAVLILSELVSNALRHARPLAGGTIRVAWRMFDDRVLRIAVTDGGRPAPGTVPSDPEDGWYAADLLDPADDSGLLAEAEAAGLVADAEARPGPAAGAEHRPGSGEPLLTAAALDEVDESAVDGRGLGIVGALADAWGVEPFLDGGAPNSAAGPSAAAAPVTDPCAPKTVWAEVRVHARHAAPLPPDQKRRRGRHDPGGRPPRRLRLVRTVLASLWPGGSGAERGEPSAWVPRYLGGARAAA